MKIQLHDESAISDLGIDTGGIPYGDLIDPDKNPWYKFLMGALDSIFRPGGAERDRLARLIATWRRNNWGALMTPDYSRIIEPRKGMANLDQMTCAELQQYAKQFKEYQIPYYSDPANFAPGTKERVVARYATMQSLFAVEVLAKLKSKCGIDEGEIVPTVQPAGEFTPPISIQIPGEQEQPKPEDLPKNNSAGGAIVPLGLMLALTQI